MKKKILFCSLGLVAVAALITVGINNSSALSELKQQNIAALANDSFENTIVEEGRKTCYARRGEKSEMSTAVVCGNPGCFTYTGYSVSGKKSTC